MDPNMHLEVQTYAIDSECSDATMFNSEEDKKQFDKYFKNKCLGKNNCTLDFSEFNLHELISSACLKRIFND